MKDSKAGRPDEGPPPTVARWRDRLHEIIFEADTPAGKAFDVTLLVLIAASILAVMLETVSEYREQHGLLLYRVEWAFTILFTIEYVMRLICVRRPLRYAFSFYGIVDVLAILPTYMELLPYVGETRSLLLIRSLRLLRIFRVFKLVRYVGEARELQTALAASRAKIFVFLWTVMIVVLIVGAAMYLIEGPDHGFDSIPQSTYWAIVTMTTVGYGDIAPETVPGKLLASLLMITGYGIIAVPTGIVSAEMAQIRGRPTEVRTRSCVECTAEGHLADAVYCRRCGKSLNGDDGTSASTE
ncbi:MAG: ion transporter [Phycisphaerales bacterium]